VKKSETFPQFINAFTYNIYLNEVYPYYNSISHSSFINNNNLINGHRNGNDGDGGMRAHPVLQLRGKWVDNKFTSDTEVEGYVYGRYMDSYYTKMKRGEKVEVSDTDFVDDISDEEINNPNYDPDAEPDPDDPDNVNDEHEYADSSINIDSDGFENTKFIYTEGPKIRLQHADDYNSKAVYTPYNRTGIKYPVSLNTLDPDFANIYLDKITAVYIDYIDFAHNCIKIDGDAMTIYLNGIYLINSAFPIPISDNIKTVKYVGKGALLVSGDIAIKTDIKAADNHSFLILATVGRRHDNELKNSTIFVQGDGENALDIQASLVALNRDYPRAGGTNKNMGLSLPNFIMLSYGTKITGNWVADHLFYYPQGMDSSTPNKIKGTNLIYDKRLSNRNASDLNFYLADIGLPYAFFHVGRQTTSEF